MHTPSILVATAAVFATIASAEPERPRFYFPRQVKRQIFANTTLAPSKETKQDPLTSSSSKRSLSNFLNGPGTTGNIFDGILSPLAATPSDDGVTTVVIQHTHIVPEPTTAPPPSHSDPLAPIIGSTGLLPPIIVLPTTSSTLSLPSETTLPSATGTGITFGPGGILTSSSEESKSSGSADLTENHTGVSFSGTAGTTARASTSTDEPGLIPILSGVISGVSSILAPPSSTSAGLLSSIVGSLTDILPTITSGLTGPASTGVPTNVITTDPPAPTTTADSTGLGGILSSIIDPLTSDISVTTPTISGVITATDPPLTTPTVLPPYNSTDVTQPTSTGPTDVITTPTSTATGLPPSGNGTSTGPTSVPAGNGTEATATSTPPATLPTNGTAVVAPTSITSAPVSVTSAPTETAPPSLIVPTGTDSGTSMWLPQTIIVASSAALSAGAVPTSEPTGIPSQLPQIITAPNGTLETPDGMKLIQLGFMFPLNWRFVAEHSMSAAQIFLYLPIGLYEGLNLREDQVKMHSLVPLDTSVALGFVTTTALAYIPENMFSTLALDLHVPLAAIYTNPDASVSQLMNYIDSAIPLEPGSALGASAATGTGSGSSPTSNPGGNNGVFNTDAQNTTPAVRSTTAGIAMGCVGAAAAYGAAMFFIARRYKRRKQSHRRSSSIMSNSEMRQSGSPALLGGANPFMSGGRTTPGGTTNNDRNSRGSGRSAGNSARTQQISAPMMAENSLGWN